MKYIVIANLVFVLLFAFGMSNGYISQNLNGSKSVNYQQLQTQISNQNAEIQQLKQDNFQLQNRFLTGYYSDNKTKKSYQGLLEDENMRNKIFQSK